MHKKRIRIALLVFAHSHLAAAQLADDILNARQNLLSLASGASSFFGQLASENSIATAAAASALASAVLSSKASSTTTTTPTVSTITSLPSPTSLLPTSTAALLTSTSTTNPTSIDSPLTSTPTASATSTAALVSPPLVASSPTDATEASSISSTIFSSASAGAEGLSSTNRPSTSAVGAQAGGPGIAAASSMSSSSPTEAGGITEEERDPANGAFPGGVPIANIDVPITFVFLALFITGAFTHISIYRANSKRGHKFLLSDLMFDFCMIRNLACIFRIIWAFISPRGVILVSLIFENGGATVIFAVNLFFAQRIVRAMHPKFGWSPVFTFFSMFLIWSCPAVIIMNIITISISFFSVGKPQQLMNTEMVLLFGASWNMMLVTMPLVWLVLAGAFSGKKPESFGTGQLRQKASLLAFGATALAFGAAVRLAADANPQPPDTTETLYSKAIFYTTGFMLEIIVVAAYAAARIDLLFHIPDGSKKPGDYTSGGGTLYGKKSLDMLQPDIEASLDALGVAFEAIGKSSDTPDGEQVMIAKLRTRKPLPTPEEKTRSIIERSGESSPTTSIGYAETYMPPRPDRVSRRQTIIDGLQPYMSKRNTQQIVPFNADTFEPNLGESFFVTDDDHYSQRRTGSF